MKKKALTILITILLLLFAFSATGLCAYAGEGSPDNSALLAAFDKISCYDEADYTAESYGALSSLYEQYSLEYEGYTTQEQTDLATASLLEATSDLRAYLSLTVTADNNAQISVSYGETAAGAGKQTVVYGTSVSLAAPEIEGFTFGGWLETTSKRILSSSRSYTFTMTVKTALRAVYYKNTASTLTFKNSSGQIVSTAEKSPEAWAELNSLEGLIPAVPYRFGFTNGRWAIPADALSRLAAGENVVVTPEYDSADGESFASPASVAGGVNLKLYYRHDLDSSVGSFVMTTAIPQEITPEAVGMIFYNKKADSFNPASFDVNINNKMLASQFDVVNDEKYITNINHLSSKYNWAVKGYASYYQNGKLITVYSNQVNIVNTEDVHELQTIPAVAPTCTESGNTAGTYCDICGKYFDVEEINPLGHNYESVVTAPTCTTGGYTTYTCSRCNDTYTSDEVNALGHDYESVVTAPTCTAGGYTTFTCLRCNDTYTSDEVNALGHDYESVVTAPTCTAGGYTTYICSRCNDTYTGDEVNALGHDYESVVTAPTCTAGGYTTYICSRCGDTYTGNETAPTGHSFGAWTVTTAPTVDTDGVETRTCTSCNTAETRAVPALNIEVKLPNTESYLYRAGNANNISAGSLFKAKDETKSIDSSAVSITVESIAGSAAGTFTANTSDWTAATLKFTGTGVVKLSAKRGAYVSAVLYLEVVAGTNYAEGASLANITSNNAVLLGDVNCTKISLNNGKTLYGNGFSVTDTRTDFSGAANAYITMSGNGSIDNAVLLGAVYPTAVTSGQSNQYYAPGVWIIGNANIYTSYISETKNAVQIDSGTVYFENSTFAGGALANIDIGGGDVTLKNCITKTTDRDGLKALGIRAKTAACKIHILGSLTQYNFLKKSDLPSSYSTFLSSMYNNTTFAYSYNSNTYLNMGIFFLTEAESITEAQARTAIDDQTGNNYGYIEKTASSITGTVYTMKAESATPSLLTAPAYDETVNGQYPISPAYSFDYTNKNYIAKTEGSNRYCYYDSTTSEVKISFDKEDSSSAFNWDPMILTATKNGNTLPYTVSMNGTNYTNSTISFTESGDYQVVYTYTDPYNYSLGGAAFNKTYTKTVNINVTAVEPDAQVYYASLSYDGAAGNYSAKKVIGTDSKTYVMPDVSATSETIGSTSVAGKTVYYPIVTVNPTTSNGNTAYSSGKGYYFAPVFSELHIIDYNQDTGAQQYEYSKSTSYWPHDKGSTTGPDTAYFTCASGEKTWSGTSPYARSMNSSYYKYGKNNLGVCYTSNEIEANNSASTHLVQYHYVSNDGTTYYYYIQYKFGEMAYSSCVTEGTLVTMADGTQKPIEDTKVGDMVMTWSMWKGCYEPQPIALRWYHGKKQWQVLTLNFSDGTSVRTINQHGFFDVDKNRYVYITPSNVNDYIGDSFVKQKPDGSNAEIQLSSFELTYENVGCYSIQTAYNESFMVENMLSMTGEDYKGRFEYFDVGDGMKYDEAKMQSDIAKYGLYEYEEFSDYLTPEQFEMFNGAYFKILVGKGVFTEEDILKIISDNL